MSISAIFKQRKIFYIQNSWDVSMRKEQQQPPDLPPLNATPTQEKKITNLLDEMLFFWYFTFQYLSRLLKQGNVTILWKSIYSSAKTVLGSENTKLGQIQQLIFITKTKNPKVFSKTMANLMTKITQPFFNFYVSFIRWLEIPVGSSMAQDHPI